MLDVWPLLPIVVRTGGLGEWGMDNVWAALKHTDRICELHFIDFSTFRLNLGDLLAEMQQPFPALTTLKIMPRFGIFEGLVRLVLPPSESFLGGSAPRLQTLHLCGIPFPGSSILLLSATQLVDLNLMLTHSENFFPGTMLSHLSVLTRLERLKIEFDPRQSLPDWPGKSRDPPLLTCTLLPVLTNLWLQGSNEYLEVLVAWIDTPLLDTLTVIFRPQPIFNTPQLIQFISRSPKFKPCDEARVVIDYNLDAWVTLPQKSGGKIQLELLPSQPCRLLPLAQLCNLSTPRTFTSAVEHLYIVVEVSENGFDGGDMENSPARWLEIFHPFTAVKGLYVSHELVLHIADTLQELVGGRVTEVLPALQTLFIDDRLPSGVEQYVFRQFVAARRLAGHPIAVSLWNGIKDIWDEEKD
jgi:hypothetical protein